MKLAELFDKKSINEYKIIKLDYPIHTDFPVFKNPSFSELKGLLAKYYLLRGFTDNAQNVYVWEADQSEHYSVESHFLSSINFQERFIIGRSKNLEEWIENAVELYPNIWMGISGEDIIRSNHFVRMVRLSYEELKEAIKKNPIAAKVVFGPGKIHPKIDEQIQLNELKEYLDRSYYGSWIHPDGTIDMVNNHTDWLKDNYGPGHRFNWGMAFDNGWVRIVHEHTSLDIQGNLDDIVKTFKYWWPTAIKSDTVFVDVVKFVDNIRTEYSMSKRYKIPKDKVKLRQDFGPQQKTITEEKIVQAAFKDPATGKIYPTGQMHDMEVAMKEFGFDPDNDNDWEGFTKIYNTLINGFITDKGRFFNRQEAAKLVRSPEEKLSTELVKGMGPNPHWQRRGVSPEIKESISWDLEGYWITNEGDILGVDHDKDIHHAQIALDHFIDYFDDLDDEHIAELAIETAFDDGWIRVSIIDTKEMSISFVPGAMKKSNIRKMANLIKKDQEYDRYVFGTSRFMKEYNTKRKALQYLGQFLA